MPLKTCTYLDIQSQVFEIPGQGAARPLDDDGPALHTGRDLLWDAHSLGLQNLPHLWTKQI